MKPCIGFAQASAGDVNHSTQLRQIVNGLAWVATKGVASRDRLWGDARNLRSRDTRMESNPPQLPQGAAARREARERWGRKHLSTSRKRNQLRSRH